MTPFDPPGRSTEAAAPTRSLAALLDQARGSLHTQHAPAMSDAVRLALADAGARAAVLPAAWAPKEETKEATLLPQPAPSARPPWSWPSAWAWLGAGSFACLVMFAGALLLPWSAGTAPPDAAQEGSQVLADGSAFVPVVSAERWDRLQLSGGTPAWVVPTELPHQQLARWGLPFDPARASEGVRAELLMQASGEVLAVRLLR